MTSRNYSDSLGSDSTVDILFDDDYDEVSDIFQLCLCFFFLDYFNWCNRTHATNLTVICCQL